MLESQCGKLQMGGVILNADGTLKTPLHLSAGKISRPFVPFPCELQHDSTARNAIADALVDLIDGGTTNTEGRLIIYTANKITLLATVLLANPAFGDAVTGVADGLGLPWSDPFAAGTGIAAEFDIVDRDENIILTGDVALSGEEITFPDLEINVNDIVKILSCSYTAPP